MMNVLNDDPEAPQVSELPSESLVKTQPETVKSLFGTTVALFFGRGRMIENFSLKGGSVYWARYAPSL